ncbi:glycosyltransferase family 2 protein [Lachnoclostridium sp. Marseille-P6806]|uniref:glycosyltransferase family 2 protein n=1 Tax=Lachnoclostridium sp. Marseille-P6806 TaxID=2364793 RepID=UPI00102FD449|nr:glycosyltransferase family 2 protein [Lachnoclostridium sp. Marseille-P6806]
MISIIVPVYNAERYLRETIRAVRMQSFTDWELILVDDGSSDGSAALIGEEITAHERDKKEWQALSEDAGSTPAGSGGGDARGVIRLIRKKRNEGAAAARNTGVDAASGRYVAFLDADDLWRPEKLERELRFMQEQDAAFVFCSYQFGDENAVPTGRAVHVPPTLSYREALSRTVIFTSTVLLDTEKLDRELLHMPCIGSEDTATWWNILKTGVAARGLDELLVVYRRPAGQSLSSNKWTAVKRIWRLYREVAGLRVPAALYCLLGWAWRASLRRIVRDRTAAPDSCDNNRKR